MFLDEDSLFDGASYDSGTPETSAMFARISSEASERISDFAIERQIVLGCFMDPSSQMISESRQFIDQLENGPTGNVLLDALAGDESARTALKDANIPQYSPFDVDPHAEYEVGDVDNTVRYAASLAANGHSIVVDGTFPKHRGAGCGHRIALPDEWSFRAVRARRGRAEASVHPDGFRQ